MLSLWAGKSENVSSAQDQLLKRAQAHGAAAKGEYEGGVDGTINSQSS